MTAKKLAAAGAALASVAALAAAPASADYGPDTCLQGYVWRGVTATDHVCVKPAVRAQVTADNAAAASRRDPNGGAFGPNTCLSGYVWRAAVAGDVVCVAPATRTQAASDNRLAAVRRNTLHTVVGTYYKGDSPRYRVTTDHINLGIATVAFYSSGGRRLATWSKAVVDDPTVPGGRLTLRSGVLSCYGQRNAYFKVRDPSSGRWSAPVYVARGCVQID